MICNHCHAETSNGLALCELCQRKAVSIFEYLPIYFRNLARWRPGRAGSRPVPGSRVLYDGDLRVNQTGDRISDRLDEALSALVTWAIALADDRPTFAIPLEVEEDQPATVAVLCAAFEKHLTSIATTEWCGEFVRDLSRHENVLRSLTETSVPGWYAGGCKRCETGMWVIPGLTWVTCQGCGTTVYARDRLEVILAEARPWVAPPMRIAEALVALIDGELSVSRLHKRISKWGEREQVAIHRKLDGDGDPVGPKRYRLGEVLDTLRNEGPTRLDEALADEAPKAS